MSEKNRKTFAAKSDSIVKFETTQFLRWKIRYNNKNELYTRAKRNWKFSLTGKKKHHLLVRGNIHAQVDKN